MLEDVSVVLVVLLVEIEELVKVVVVLDVGALCESIVDVDVLPCSSWIMNWTLVVETIRLCVLDLLALVVLGGAPCGCGTGKLRKKMSIRPAAIMQTRTRIQDTFIEYGSRILI